MATSLTQRFRERDYERRRQQQDALSAMKLAFDKEKYEDTKERQRLSDERAVERFNWAEMEQNIKSLQLAASPIVQTLENPLDLDNEDFENVGKSITSWYDKSMNTYLSEEEQSAIKANKELLDNLYSNATTYRESTNKLTQIRTALDNLVGEYRDEQGNMIQGEFNTKNVNSIVANIQDAIASYSKSGNEEIIKAFQAYEKEATQTSFVARELERYFTPGEDGKRLVDTMQNRGLAEIVKKAKTAQEAEEYGTAYNLLSGTGQTEEGFEQAQDAIAARKAGDDAEDKLSAWYNERRAFADHHIGIIKTALTEKEAGAFAGSLSRLASFDTTKTNALTDPEDFKAYDSLMFNLIKNIHTEDSRKIDNYGWGIGGSDILKSQHSGIKNDMEATNLLLAGEISKNDDGHYIWASGDKYMLNVGGGGYEKVPGNQAGEFELDKNMYRNEIDANLKKLDYGDSIGGEADKIRHSIASAASLWLKLNPDLEYRRQTTSDAARKTPENLSADQILANASEQETTVQKVIQGEESTSELVGITGDANVMKAMEGFKNTNAKFLIEFPDGSEEYLRAKEWQSLRSLHSDSSQIKGMKIKMVTNVADKNDPKATNKVKGAPFGSKAYSDLQRAKKLLSRANKQLKNKPNSSHYLAQKKEAEEIIARIEEK